MNQSYKTDALVARSSVLAGMSGFVASLLSLDVVPGHFAPRLRELIEEAEAALAMPIAEQDRRDGVEWGDSK